MAKKKANATSTGAASNDTSAQAAVQAAPQGAAPARAPSLQFTVFTSTEPERLTKVLSLNRDGTLKGRPRCRVEQASITASNQPQASLHCERAIRAVQLAAPFDLPDQFYDRWKALEWQFDRRL
mgnify:CR=1 FL=1